MANVIIRIAVKDAAWHTTNAAVIIEKGRYVGLEGSNPLRIKIGDGITQLQNLVFTDAGLVQEITDREDADAIIEGLINNHIADLANPHQTSLEQARTADNFFEGEVDMNGNRLRNLPTPTNADDAVRKDYLDALIDTTIKALEGYDPTATSLYPTTYNALAIKKGVSFKVTVNGTINGKPVKVGDFLIAQTNNPGQIDANWMIGQTNVDQATESEQGIAKIVSQATIEDEFTSNNTDTVTAQKFWFGILRFISLAWTWSGIQTFTNGIKTSLFDNSTGEFKFTKTVAGTILIWTNGQHLRFSATTGGAPSIEIDKTTGKVKLLDETASRPVKLDANKGLTSGAFGSAAGEFCEGNDSRLDQYEIKNLKSLATTLTNAPYYLGMLVIAWNVSGNSRRFQFERVGTITRISFNFTHNTTPSTQLTPLVLRNNTTGIDYAIGNIQWSLCVTNNGYMEIFTGLSVPVGNTTDQWTLRLDVPAMGTYPSSMFTDIKIYNKY